MGGSRGHTIELLCSVDEIGGVGVGVGVKRVSGGGGGGGGGRCGSEVPRLTSGGFPGQTDVGRNGVAKTLVGQVVRFVAFGVVPSRCQRVFGGGGLLIRLPLRLTVLANGTRATRVRHRSSTGGRQEVVGGVQCGQQDHGWKDQVGVPGVVGEEVEQDQHVVGGTR